MSASACEARTSWHPAVRLHAPGAARVHPAPRHRSRRRRPRGARPRPAGHPPAGRGRPGGVRTAVRTAGAARIPRRPAVREREPRPRRRRPQPEDRGRFLARRHRGAVRRRGPRRREGTRRRGPGAGRPRRDHGPHRLRVDAPRLRRLGRRTRHRPRLSHLVPLPGPLDPPGLRCRRPDHRDRRPGRRHRPGTAAPARPAACVGHGEGARRRSRGRRGPHTRPRDRGAPGHARPRHPRHPRVHLRHHRPPQGLRPHPRQLLRRGGQRHRAALPRLPGPHERRGVGPALPSHVPHLRPYGRRRLRARPGAARARAQPGRRGPASRPGRLPAHLPAHHPVHAGEGVQHRPRQGRGGRPPVHLRPRGDGGPPLRRGPGGTADRHRQRPLPLPEDGPRLLRPAGVPKNPQRHGRQSPLRHLRRLPAGPQPRRLLRRGGHRDLRGLRPHRDHRRLDRHTPAEAPPGHRRLAPARHEDPDRGGRRGPGLRRARAARLLGPAGGRGRARHPGTAGSPPATSASWTTRAI
ncbi:hypothetical protein RKD39_002967 [Streptomyces albogriseolus]